MNDEYGFWHIRTRRKAIRQLKFETVVFIFLIPFCIWALWFDIVKIQEFNAFGILLACLIGVTIALGVEVKKKWRSLRHPRWREKR